MEVDGLRLPDFIIGGAPRCATTWLYTLADLHADIAMAKPVRPEPKFFLADELFARGLAHYSQTWFAALPAGRCLGEKSTNYLESPTAAKRIRRSIPDVKLVFLLRNPVDRAYSNYLWSRMNGLETEDFGRALELEAKREAELPKRLRYARPFTYFSRGLYADHLASFFGLFGRDRILVLRHEDVVDAPGRVAADFFRFLGVAPQPAHADTLGPVNAAADDDTPDMPPGLRAELTQRYAEPNRQLAALLGSQFRLWGD